MIWYGMMYFEIKEGRGRLRAGSKRDVSFHFLYMELQRTNDVLQVCQKVKKLNVIIKLANQIIYYLESKSTTL